MFSADDIGTIAAPPIVSQAYHSSILTQSSKVSTLSSLIKNSIYTLSSSFLPGLTPTTPFASSVFSLYDCSSSLIRAINLSFASTTYLAKTLLCVLSASSDSVGNHFFLSSPTLGVFRQGTCPSASYSAVASFCIAIIDHPSLLINCYVPYLLHTSC